MEMTEERMEHLCRLARLQLTPEERREAAKQLEGIVAYMDVLSQLEPAGGDPLYHPLPLKNVLRPDECVPSLSREKLLRQAPKHDEDTFLVPQVVE